MIKLIKILALFLFFILITLTIILSTIGYETKKFNNIISKKIIEKNKNVKLELYQVKFKLEIQSLSLFLETRNPELIYQSLKIPVKNVRVYLDIISLIKSKTKINKIDINSKEIDINQIKKILLKTKPSNFNSLVLNKVKAGKLQTNIELYLKENFEVANYLANGTVIKMDAVVNKDLFLKNSSFNFLVDNSDIMITEFQSKLDGILFKDGNLNISRGDDIKIKTDFSTIMDINKNEVKRYLKLFENFNKNINTKNLSAQLFHELEIVFDNTFRVKDYVYKNKGQVNEFKLNLQDNETYNFFSKQIKYLIFQETNIEMRISSDKKNYFSAEGLYKADDLKPKNYILKNNFSNKKSNIELNFDFLPKLNFEIIGYTKEDGVNAKIAVTLSKDRETLNFKKIEYVENSNLIFFENLKIRENVFISLDRIKVKTFEKSKLKNDFVINFEKIIKINGSNYNAKNLNKLINKKTKKNYFNKINKKIEINLKNIETSLSKQIKNFRLIGYIEKGKFIKISSKGDFGDNKFLDISLKNDKKNKKKFLEIFSDLPQPLLTDYTFFNGLSGGNLSFFSTIENDNSSSSNMTIENFKIVNAPNVVKLLSLADFGGLADLAEGDGLSFDKLEIKMSTKDNFLTLEELYAVGPSISVLMEGYRDGNNLTSLRGTLVPAKNLNKLLSKIPVIGDIIIPKDVGEGLFGVSFKMKGPPGKIKTSINPIKTLTPRFITKALERSK